MQKWYKDKLRRTLIDMHIEDWTPEFMASFSPEDYFESLKIAKINAPMIYIQSHVGYCYWPTKSGKMHSAFAGREDAMKRLFDLCHQEGMAVIAYYSLIYNNWAYEQYPAWQMKTADGHGSRENGSRYGLCCPNNHDYRDFVRVQMKEFSDYFDFEAIFLDMTFWPMVCYCDQCKKRWSEEVGGEMPRIIDWKDDRWLLFQEKRQAWLGEFAQDMTAEIKKNKPECDVEHQYSTALHNWRWGVNENISKASDYAGGDLYGGIAQQSFACKLYYNLTQNQPFEYMTSRCYPALNEHTSTKSMDLIQLSVMLTYIHHGACLLIDAIDPVGTHDRRVYEKMGQVFAMSEPLEPYLKRGDMRYDVGLYFNLNGKMNVETEPVDVMKNKDPKNAVPHMESAMGAAKTLQENKIPYGVLNNWRLELLNDLRVLVLSDVPNMSDEEIDQVRKYVSQGGKAYISGHSCWPFIEEVLGTAVTGYSDENIVYFAPDDSHSDTLEGEFTQKYPMALFEKAVLLSGKPKGDVLCSLTMPYTVPNPMGIFDDTDGTKKDTSFRDQDPRYRFSSIHSNPPGWPSEQAAMVRVKYGEGEVIWSCVPFEKADRPQHQALFAGLIRDLAGQKLLFSCDGPAPVEIVMFEDAENEQILLGMINLQETFKTIPVYDFNITVTVNGTPKCVKRLPDESEIAFDYADNQLTFHVDKLQHHGFYLIQY